MCGGPYTQIQPLIPQGAVCTPIMAGIYKLSCTTRAHVRGEQEKEGEMAAVDRNADSEAL